MIRQLVWFIAVTVASFSAYSQNTPQSQGRVASSTAIVADVPAAYSGPVNYVRTWEPQISGYTDASSVMSNGTVSQVHQATQYVDGLGRPLQTVSYKMSPNGMDIVAPSRYDEFGRESLKYLPYAATTADGQLKTDPFTDQNSFYTNTYKTEQPAYTGEQYFYSKTIFEPSPLNRVSKSFAPGNSWVGSEGSSSEHAVSIEYLINTQNDDVKIWNIGFNQSSFEGIIPTTTASYDPGQLYKTVTKDEKGNAVVEYKDKEDHVVLKKVQIDNVSSPYEGHTGWLCTYYVYDDLGNLRFVIPPKAVVLINGSWSVSSVSDELCFHYEYDSRNRMIGKKVPGAAWVYMVYDKRDRLVFTQDGNLHAKGQWMATVYDELNRPIKTGLMAYNINRGDLQGYMDGLGDDPPVTQTTSTGSTTGSVTPNLVVSTRETGRQEYHASSTIEIQPGFTSEDNALFTAEIVPANDASFSTTQTTVYYPIPGDATFVPLTITNYNDYVGAGKTFTNYASNLTTGSNTYAEDAATAASTASRGLPTWTKVRVLTSTDITQLASAPWLETVTFYDAKGRVAQVKSGNYKGGEDAVSNRYNFTGKVVSSYSVHNNPAGNIANLSVLAEMQYDDAGRVTDVYKTVAGDPLGRHTITHNEYDALGQLKHKQLGQKKSDDGTSLISSPLEDQTYAYNVRGWLKSINWDYQGAQATTATKPTVDYNNNKWFAMDLSYDWGYGVNQYNGNIAGMRWATAGDQKERSFGYDYDKADRLLKADFVQNFGSGGTQNWATIDPSNNNFTIDFSVKMGATGNDDGTAYDANGNILKMWQKGLKMNSSDWIDKLSYNYHNNEVSNRLLAVTEDLDINTTDNKLGDFTDKNRSLDDYTYDVNGNLTADKNKNISAIEYNHLNLPYKITVNNPSSSNGTITYIYDAAGNKLEKYTDEGMSSTNNQEKKTYTTYLGSYVYENNELQFFAQEEGRIRQQIQPNGSKAYTYDYFLKDHLGNVRMVLTDEKKTDIYQATSETSVRSFEDALFSNIDETSTDKPDGFDYDNNNHQVSNLGGVNDGTLVGPGKLLKVMAGDKVRINTFGWYTENYVTPQHPDGWVAPVLSDIVTALMGSGIYSLGKGQSVPQVQNILSPDVTNFLNNQQGAASGGINAHLTWVLLDEEQLKMVNESSGFVQMPTIEGDMNGNRDIKQFMQGTDQYGNPDITMKKNGYLYVYVSNSDGRPVFFDDLHVEHVRGPLQEETHYYPFGLTMAGISSKAAGSIQNKNKFNGGNELQSGEFSDGSGLEMYDAVHRMYDQQLGKFHQIDALADVAHRFSPYAFANDNPISSNDPLGLSTQTPGVNPDNKDDNAILAEVVVSNKRKSSGGFAGFYWPSSTSSERKQWRDNQNLYYSRTLNNQPAVQKGDPLSYRSSVGLYKKWDIEEQNYRAMQSFAVGVMATPVLVSTAPTAVITALRFKLAANVPAAVADVVSQAVINSVTPGKNVIGDYNPVSTALAFGIGPVAEGVSLPAIANIAGVSLLTATVSTSVDASSNSFNSGSHFSFNPIQIIINAVFGAAAGSNGRVVELGGSKAVAEGASVPFSIAGGLFSDKAK